jgi:tetratricopeptide (TPR) repeat protein
MEIPLNRFWPRTAFLALSFLFSGMLIVLSARAYLAARWNASSNPELWLKAAQLEPGNAECWRHAGVFRQWDANHSNIDEALHYLQIATKVNSRSSGLWLDLGDTYAMSGDASRARDAYEKAQRSFPISSEIAWRYGNFLLYQQDYAEAYPQIRRAISIDPSLTWSALAECWRVNPTVAPILDRVLPERPDYYRSAMTFFLSQNLVNPALALWNRQEERGVHVDIEESMQLVDTLIHENRIPEATRVWEDGLQTSNWPRDPQTNGSVVFNGGFEHEIANGGFDWQEFPIPGANSDFVSVFVHTGTRSLRIEFDGTENPDFAHVFQYVPVAPATRYHFSALVRTERLSTDEGISFEILDALHSARTPFITPQLTGTHRWTALETDFLTESDTQVLKITLRRVPSWKFDNKLNGTVWVDDVELIPTRAVKD